ncbi:MAG: hypothetical protein JWM99_2279 [Verrucomicrobiales bacterium]|jgi:predicted CoA-binding protein|nr:hypothetical protein [Verrucomicrobiales bacterium]
MKTAAIIGAHNDRSRWGNKAVRAFMRQGFEVFPVSPTESQIEGLRAFKKIAEVPTRLNLVSIYVRPEILLKLLPEIAEKGCDELWLNPGTASPEVLEKAVELKLKVIQGCSILGIGVSPSTL